MSNSWVTLPLSKVCTKITDGTHHSPTVQFQEPSENRYKYVTSKNLRPWGLDLTDIDYVDEKTHREIYSRCNPEKGDVLLTKDGANTGMVAINTLDEEFSLLSSVAVLKPDPTKVESRYLRYFIESPEGSNRLVGKMTGTAIRRIILKQIKEAEISLAPLPEQRRIVAEIEIQFTRLDAGVTALRRVQANLKRYRAAVLKAACEGSLVTTEAELAKSGNQKAKFETGKALLARILAERRQNWQGRGKYKEPDTPDTAYLPSIPEGWIWASVEQLLIEPLCNGVSVKGSDSPPGVRALRLSAMSNSGFDYADVRYLPLAESTVDDLWIQEGDFFMSRGNGSLHLVGRGTSAQKSPHPTIFPDTMIRLRLADAVRTSGWLRTLWPSRIIRSQIETRVKTTAGIYKISQPQVEGMVIPLPPLAEQARIVAEVERRLSVVEESEAAVSANLQRAIRLRRSILQQAFTGNL